MAKVTEPRHTLPINACTISQYAALAALTGPQEPVQQMARISAFVSAVRATGT